jgi:hypothetical protein
MSRALASPPRLTLVVACALAIALIVTGCGSKPKSGGGPAVLGQRGDQAPQGPPLGFPVLATKNTTRVAGADPVADAAAAARAVYPARTPESRPQAVVLVDVNDWRAAISASQLMSRPLRAPILFTDGDKLPAATAQALKDLAPTGARTAGGTQVLRVGVAPAPDGLKATAIGGASPAALAQAIDRVVGSAAGKPSPAVMVAPADRPDLAMPAAAWAAKAGDPVLWASGDTLPPETLAAIRSHRKPRIYVLGPPEAISDAVVKQLKTAGTVKRIGTGDPVTNAIFFARYSDGAFGWNVVDPGHGVVIANARRTADAAGAAPLSASGTYGPLLLVTEPGALPQPLQDYLLDIQPGYDKDPVRGVYNHGWLVGDESAVSADVQSRIDALLEIQPVDTGGK